MVFPVSLSPGSHYTAAGKENQGGRDSKATGCSLMSPALQSKNIDNYLCGLGKAAQSQVKANVSTCLHHLKEKEDNGKKPHCPAMTCHAHPPSSLRITHRFLGRALGQLLNEKHHGAKVIHS